MKNINKPSKGDQLNNLNGGFIFNLSYPCVPELTFSSGLKGSGLNVH